jgi:hypothetical protein
MNRRSPWPLVALIACVAAGLWIARPWDTGESSKAGAGRDKSRLMRPERPSEPPVPGRDRPERPPEPKEPPGLDKVRADAYAQARGDGQARPGDAAFRATIDAFLDYNAEFAEAQAQAEGLTVAEVRELTYFGFMVMETQRWPEVEDILGQELTADQRERGEALMHRFNTEFKSSMRDLVEAGAPEDDRWKLIRDTGANYRREYAALTGMSDEQLDDLLAGDITRTGAPIATPPPDEMPANPDPPRADQTRPGSEPH